MGTPLAGVKVLELAVAVAGPAAAAVLADWGADVVKVEQAGDRSRQSYASIPGVDEEQKDQLAPLMFVDNRGKKSVVLDLKDPAGREAFEALLAGADVFVSNLREKANERLGLGCQQILERYPKMVVGRVTGYGRYGPDQDLPAYEPTAFWARGGVAESHRSYDAEYPPMLTGAMADHTTGALCAGGIAAALYQTRATGKGQVVDASLLRTALYMNSWANQFSLSLGGVHNESKAVRSMRPYTARRPYWGQGPVSAFYRTSDEKLFYFTIQAAADWAVLCETIGRPELATDPRFETAALRREGANGEELFQAIQAAFKTKTQDEWAEAFQAADLVGARVQSPEEVVKDPQIVAALVDVPASPPTNDDGSARDYAHGVVRTVPSPVDFSAAGLAEQQITQPKGPVAALGEHTASALREAGVSEALISQVLAQIEARPRM